MLKYTHYSIILKVKECDGSRNKTDDLHGIKSLEKLPKDVKDVFLQGLYVASIGDTPPESKPLKGFGGRNVVELMEDYKSDTYRAVYTIRFKEVIYVLHVFKKKSKKGIETPKEDMDLIKQRLKNAISHYELNFR